LRAGMSCAVAEGSRAGGRVSNSNCQMLRDRALDLMPVEGAVSRVSERLEARDLVPLCGIWRISLHRAQNSLLDRSRPRFSPPADRGIVTEKCCPGTRILLVQELP
jgi:hypothetical protein